jgi:hypothetical protein
VSISLILYFDAHVTTSVYRLGRRGGGRSGEHCTSRNKAAYINSQSMRMVQLFPSNSTKLKCVISLLNISVRSYLFTSSLDMENLVLIADAD